jgi:hypothetical protein
LRALALIKVYRSFADIISNNKTGHARVRVSRKRIWNMLHVRCTRCKQLIDVSDHQTYLARERKLVRIRCREENCRNDDWYSEAEFEGNPSLPSKPVSDPGQSKTQWYDFLTSGL